MEKQREQWVDSARGIAIVLVVIGHVVASYHEADLYTDNALYNFISQFVYSFHMALFMIVSGYLYSRSHHTNKSVEIKKRLLSTAYHIWSLPCSGY